MEKVTFQVGVCCKISTFSIKKKKKKKGWDVSAKFIKNKSASSFN